MVINSFKSSKEFYNNFWSLPSTLNFENYKNAIDATGIANMFLNTVFIVACALVINIAISSMIAYVIARMNVRLGDAMYKFFLFGMLTPGIVTLIPLFLIARTIGLFNTRIILILVYAGFEVPFAVFVFTSFYKTLPSALEEAAYIDGATRYQTFFRVIFPLSIPGIVTVGVFNFIEYWNDYLIAMTLVVDESKKTVSLGVMKLQAANAVRTEWGQLFAVCTLVVLPVLLVYIIFQRNLTSGLTAGAVKG
ncbi:MAG: carbohydrate ABC transporter permease [Clostridiales bacterium]|nr:carbohydrate ABC transporter permease [Clostridiales bacterium]